MGKSILLFGFFLLFAHPLTGVSQPRMLPHIHDRDIFLSTSIPSQSVIKDSTNIYWSIFTSDYFGFTEFWVAYSKDLTNWSGALYTGIPVLPSDNYQIRVSKHQLDFDWRGELDAPSERVFYRAYVDTTIMGYTIIKELLYKDSDGDGLSDLAEDRIWTNPNKMDTDSDDKADGLDRNPLAAPASRLTIAEKLHKAIIEFELEELLTNQLVVVEQVNRKPMEYKRPVGLVLSLSSGACDAFVEANGYGVPILTCTVQDSTQELLKASFQFFVAPDDAWGYDVACAWDTRQRDFINFRVFNEWVAQ